MTSTLTQIKKKVRRLTASPDPTQLSDADIQEYIDTFYEQDLPAHLKLWKLRDTYTFFTEPGEDRYDTDNTAEYSFMPPAYIDGNEAYYTQSEAEFYRLYPKQNTEVTATTGDGGAAYTFTLSQAPLLKRQVTITAVAGTGEQMVGEDDGAGNLISANDDSTGLTGTVVYSTGVVSVTFPSSVDSGTPIYARIVPVTQARPRTILYFQDYFQMRPVPDKAYRVEVQMYRSPTQALAAGEDVPEISQWWQLIAFGVAKKVFEDRQDMESLQNVLGAFEEQMNLVLHRTIKQQTNQRTATIYTEQTGRLGHQVGYWG